MRAHRSNEIFIDYVCRSDKVVSHCLTWKAERRDVVRAVSKFLWSARDVCLGYGSGLQVCPARMSNLSKEFTEFYQIQYLCFNAIENL